MFGFLARRIGVADAEDLTSEVFTRAFDSRHRYDTQYADALPWLRGIARNVLYQTHRYRRTHLWNVVAMADIDVPAEDNTAAVVDSVYVAEVLSDPRLGDAVQGLQPDIRETLLMFAIDGMSYVEIADELDVPLGTVRSRLGRARRRIREQTQSFTAIDVDERPQR